jgi:hypothetical protein
VLLRNGWRTFRCEAESTAPCFVALDSPALWRRIRLLKFSQEPT